MDHENVICLEGRGTNLQYSYVLSYDMNDINILEYAQILGTGGNFMILDNEGQPNILSSGEKFRINERRAV